MYIRWTETIHQEKTCRCGTAGLLLGGRRFGREKLYVSMIRFVAPILLLFLLLQALGVVRL